MFTALLAPVLVAALALQAAPAPVAPDPAPLSQENRALVRCAAAFALVAQGQVAGDPQAKAWPDLSARGREFFVRAMAQLMDETGRDRAGIASLANAEAQALTTSGDLHKVMPSCLLMLEAAQL
jgi:hypothetical protein